MNCPEIDLIDVSPAFVVGVSHSLAEIFGERYPPDTRRNPKWPLHFQKARGPFRVDPGAKQFHSFSAGSREEYEYSQGRAYVAQRAQKDIEKAKGIHEAREAEKN